jgi:excisionase family DNA binding protein
VTDGPWGLAADAGVVWTADGDGLARIDPATGRAAVRLDEPADLVALGDGALWTLTRGELTRRDPATGRAVGEPVTVVGAMTENRSLTTAEVAAALGCNVPTVRRMIAAGALPAIRLGPPPRGQLRVPAAGLRLLPGVIHEHETEVR